MTITPTQQELRAFVGPNADSYLDAWRPALAGREEATPVNHAGAILCGLWLAHRRMYGALMLAFGIGIALAILVPAAYMRVTGETEAPLVLDLAIPFAVAVKVGLRGNVWYLARAKRVIAEVRGLELDGEAHLRAIAARGCTRPVTAAAVCLPLMAVGRAVL